MIQLHITPQHQAAAERYINQLAGEHSETFSS